MYGFHYVLELDVAAIQAFENIVVYVFDRQVNLLKMCRFEQVAKFL